MRRVLPLLTILLPALLTLAFPGPANAQIASASPGASHYETEVSGADDAANIPPAVSDNVTGGTEVVHGATRGDTAPSTETSASAGAAEEELTTLPDTSGAQLGSLFAGVSLPGCGLLRSRPRKH